MEKRRRRRAFKEKKKKKEGKNKRERKIGRRGEKDRRDYVFHGERGKFLRGGVYGFQEEPV